MREQQNVGLLRKNFKMRGLNKNAFGWRELKRIGKHKFEGSNLKCSLLCRNVFSFSSLTFQFVYFSLVKLWKLFARFSSDIVQSPSIVMSTWTFGFVYVIPVRYLVLFPVSFRSSSAIMEALVQLLSEENSVSQKNQTCKQSNTDCLIWYLGAEISDISLTFSIVFLFSASRVSLVSRVQT